MSLFIKYACTLYCCCKTKKGQATAFLKQGHKTLRELLATVFINE